MFRSLRRLRSRRFVIGPLAALLSAAAFVSVGMTSGLTGASWWPGDENTNDVISLHDAELISDARFVSGQHSRAFDLPNGTSAIKLPAETLDGFEDFTFETWIRTRDDSGTILSAANDGENNEVVVKMDDGQIIVIVKGEAATFELPGPLDRRFQHLVISRDADSGVVSFYVNGFPFGSDTLASGEVSVDENGLWLGQRQTAVDVFDTVPNEYLIGSLDEVVIYNSALRATDVTRRFELSRRDREYEITALRCAGINDQSSQLSVQMQENQDKMNGRLDDVDDLLDLLEEMLFDSHLWDERDLNVTLCGSIAGGAEVGRTDGLNSELGIDAGLGIDFYGNEISGSAAISGASALEANLAASLGLDLTACFNGVDIRYEDAEGEVQSSPLRDALQELATSLGIDVEDGNDLTLEDAGDDLIAALEALLALSSFEVDPSDPLAPVTDLANALPLSAVLAALLEDPEGAMIPEDLASLIPACGQGDLGLFDNLRGDVCSQVIPGNMPDLSSLKTEAQEFLILIDTISTIKELFDGIDLGDINLIDAMSTRIFELPLEGRVGPQGPDGPEGPEGPRGPRGFSG